MSTKVSNVRVNTYINDVNAGKNLRQMTNESRKLRNEIALLKPGTQAFIDKTKELQAVESRIRKVRAEIRGVDGAWGRAANGFNKFAGMLTAGAAALAGFALGIRNLIDRNAKLSDSISDVAKVTGLTELQIKSLMKEMKHMNTRTARSELMALAEIGGRLGIKGEADLLGFVRAADKINVSLGSVLGKPEEVMKAVGKMANSFKVVEKMGIEKAMLSIGSALNELGMASTASEGYIVEFTKRMAGIAPIAGISIENIMGLGATLDSLGQTSEVSSTALSKLFVKMAKDSDKFAKFAGMNVKDFTDLINKDANEAFIKMLEGVKGNAGALTELTEVLGELGLDGGRVVGVLGTLANNTETLRKQQDISNRSFKEGTSVIKEFNLKNENLAAMYERLQKAVYAAFVSTTVVDGLKSLTYWATKLVEVPISEQMEMNRVALNGMKIELLDTNMESSKRVEIIKKLKQEYPQYLSHIDEEKVTNKQLMPILDEINNHMLKRIALQRLQEKLENNQFKQGNKLGKQAQNMTELAQHTAKVAKQYNVDLIEGMNVLEQARNVFAKTSDKGGIFGDVGKLGRMIEEVKSGNTVLNVYEENIANIKSEMEATSNMLDRMLGLSKTYDADAVNVPTIIDDKPDTDEKIPEAKTDEKELEKRAAARKAMLEKIRAIEIQFMNEGIEKEMLIIDEKYNKLIADAGVETDLIAQLEEFKHQEKMRLMEKHLEAEGEMLNRFQEELAEDAVFWSKEQLTQMKQDIVDIQHDMRMASHDLAAESIRGFSQLAKEGSALEEALFIADQANAVSRIVFNLQQEIQAYAANPTWSLMPDGGLVLKAKAITAAKIRAGAGIASVLAQNFTRMQGFADGGYTGLGFGMPDSSGFKPAGVVHEGEYVVPKWMMQNKWVADITGMLENIRTSKSFAQGGPTTTATKVENNYSTNTTTINQDTVEALLSTLINEVRANRHVVIGDKAVRELKTRLDRDKTIDQRSKMN
jgi:TP901 family phage tail tape measure protein